MSNLQLTSSGESLLGNARGIPSALQTDLGTVSYGTLTASGTLKAAVPEPSTYAILGLGLAVFGLRHARRRA